MTKRLMKMKITIEVGNNTTAENLKMLLEIIERFIQTEIDIEISDKEEEHTLIKFEKEWDDNEAEIVSVISILRMIQEQKEGNFRMDYEHLMDNSWEFEIDEPMLEATPRELTQQTEPDSPLEELTEEEEEVAQPICPLMMYYENERDEINLDECDYEYETRSCTEACSD